MQKTDLVQVMEWFKKSHIYYTLPSADNRAKNRINYHLFLPFSRVIRIAWLSPHRWLLEIEWKTRFPSSLWLIVGWEGVWVVMEMGVGEV